VALIGKRRDAYRDLMGKLAGKGLVESPSHRWKDDISLTLKSTVKEEIKWMDLAQDREMNQDVLNEIKGKGSINLEIFLNGK
jgi:hypothetical protein